VITDPERTVLVSSLGWVEGDALWVFDARRGTHETVALGSGAGWISLHAGGSGMFAAAHHFDGHRFEVTVRRFSAPSDVVARVRIDASGGEMSGDASVWRDVPRLFVGSLAFEPWKDYVLIEVSPAASDVRVHRLPWYDERYDRPYQGIVDVLELPEERAALVAVQRCSDLVLHDLETGRAKRSIPLCHRHGNPKLAARRSAAEIWASDYDTIAVLDRADWRVDRKVLVQSAAMGEQLFIGEYSFAPDAEVCVVARPFRGDVVALDTRSLTTRGTATLGQQPFEVAALPGGEVVARDWKTGSLLRGALRRRWLGR